MEYFLETTDVSKCLRTFNRRTVCYIITEPLSLKYQFVNNQNVQMISKPSRKFSLLKAMLVYINF